MVGEHLRRRCVPAASQGLPGARNTGPRAAQWVLLLLGVALCLIRADRVRAADIAARHTDATTNTTPGAQTRSAVRARQSIMLRNRDLLAEIQPDTLETTLTMRGILPMPVSAPMDSPAMASSISHGECDARWEIAGRGIEVSAQLTSRALEVRFVSNREGRMTWPVMRTTSSTKALILPMFEGVCMPTDNAAAMAFLVEHGPMNTTADLSMPFWGIDHGAATLTYILANQFNNELVFAHDGQQMTARFTHEFARSNKVKQYGLIVHAGEPGPIGPALRYREHLAAQGRFTSMEQKIRRTPEAAKLPGAAHIYLWGDAPLAPRNVKDWKGLCQKLMAAESPAGEPVARRVWQRLSPEGRKAVADLAASEWAEGYLQREAANALCSVLESSDLLCTASPAATAPSAPPIMPPPHATDQLSATAILRMNCESLRAAFPMHFVDVDDWGDGYSPAMVDILAHAGFDRLWLGLPSQEGMLRHAGMVARARERGYLVGPYDSYHSIHPPDLKGDATWETAQFDAQLYESGPVVRADGTRFAGFKKKGFRLSSIAARPYVEKRVAGLMNAAPCNSWFMDCDAFGELNDDYSPLHPTTQEEDMHARLDRMAWIRDTYGAVVGSEGGSGYAAATIHFAHGMLTPAIGWGDRDLTEKNSPYHLGGYYPPGGPAVFMKQVPLKPKYRMPYYDPRVRVPLYQAVFHDSVIATHQWAFTSLKFTDAQTTVALIEALYQVPPMYHLNAGEFSRIRNRMQATYRFMSPLLRTTALMPLSDFDWLTPDKRVQRTRFGGRIEVIANFGEKPYRAEGGTVPPHSAMALEPGAAPRLYEPR